MEIILNKTKKILLMFFILTILGSGLMQALALSKSEIKVGDIIKFTGNSWYVYSTKANALVCNKADKKLTTISKNAKLEVTAKSGNVIKIKIKDTGKVGYIYYGSSAKDNFVKVTISNSTNTQTSTSTITTKVSFVEVAKELHTKMKNKNLYWGITSFSDFSTQTPVGKGTKVDCSSYVSWVLYEYGKRNNIDAYKDNFKTSKNSTACLNWFANHTSDFEYIGVLSASKTKVKPGDIIVKKGHIEILKEFKNNKPYCYNAGSTGAIRELVWVGSSALNMSAYKVYRVKK